MFSRLQGAKTNGNAALPPTLSQCILQLSWCCFFFCVCVSLCVHAYLRMCWILRLRARCPDNIPNGKRTPFAIAMKQFPECIVEGDPIESYRKYYNVAKNSFAKWTKRAIPEWYHV